MLRNTYRSGLRLRSSFHKRIAGSGSVSSGATKGLDSLTWIVRNVSIQSTAALGWQDTSCVRLPGKSLNTLCVHRDDQ